ncbi:MAG: ATP-binding protein, partial [Opitutales bacterium]
MKASLPTRPDTQAPIPNEPRLVANKPTPEALKASTLMILLSIGGMLGTFCLAWFVWYLVTDWKDAEFKLAKEKLDLGQPSPVVTWANDFLSNARDAKAKFFAAKNNGNNPTFKAAAQDSIEALQKKLSNDLTKSDELNDKTLEGILTSLSQIKKKNAGQGQGQVFQDKYDQLIITFDKWIEALEEEITKLEQKREQLLAAATQEHRPEDRKGLSKLMLTFAVLACGVGPLFLAWSTYRIVAHPIRLLASAAARSLDEGKPFVMKERGPVEVRSLTRRLGSLVHGLEERVQQRTQQLQTKAAQLEQEINQRKELETQLVFAQKMEAVGQLAAGIAHEVNTPSQYVCDNLRFLEEAVGDLLAAVASDEGNGEGIEKPDAEELEFLKENAPGAVEQALQGMERITSIVKSMKNFAYRDATSEKKPQDLNQAIQATIVVATNEWKYHADLQTELDPNLPFVPCNIGEINQVVLNLIVNAAHAIRDRNPDGSKGHITMSTKQYDDCVVITIQDDGGGIPEDV